MKRAWVIGGILFGLVIIVLLFRIFVHSSALLTPALIDPGVDAHRVLAPGLDARFQRLVYEVGHRTESKEQRLIALTFDDGPYAIDTPLLIAQLRDLQVPATFFLIGRDAEEQPELTARLVADGFEIGNHTRTHPNLDELSARDVANELLSGSGILARFTAAASARHYFRPPHGRYTEDTIRIAQRLGYMTVLWNDDAGDWKIDDPQELVKHIEAHAMVPEILLLHSGRLATIEMLAQIVPAFRSQGYHFVTVGQLLDNLSVDEVNHAHRLNLLPLLTGAASVDL